MIRESSQLLGIITFSLSIMGVAATAQDRARSAANLTTITEAALSSISLVSTHVQNKDFSDFSWSANLSERNWIFNGQGKLDGREIKFTMSGYLWGMDKEDWNITYSGLGNLGDESIFISGRSDWILDNETLDYHDMNFRQVMKFGENSWWASVAGAEVLFGGVIGAGSAIAGASVATGGLALGLAGWIGAGGAVAGSTALISASDTITSHMETEVPPTPQIPSRPSLPQPNEKLVPRAGKSLTAIADNTEMFGSSPDGIYALVGKYSDKIAEGNIVKISSLK